MLLQKAPTIQYFPLADVKRRLVLYCTGDNSSFGFSTNLLEWGWKSGTDWEQFPQYLLSLHLSSRFVSPSIRETLCRHFLGTESSCLTILVWLGRNLWHPWPAVFRTALYSLVEPCDLFCFKFGEFALPWNPSFQVLGLENCKSNESYSVVWGGTSAQLKKMATFGEQTLTFWVVG